jgi:hypothetical protein
VILAVRDRHADFVQPRGPVEEAHQLLGCIGCHLLQEHERQVAHAGGLRCIDVVRVAELVDGYFADVAMVHAAQQVPEHAVAQRAIRHLHLLEPQLGEDRGHDGGAARDDGDAVLLQSLQRKLAEVARREELLAQPLEPRRGDALVGDAVLLHHLGERSRRAR